MSIRSIIVTVAIAAFFVLGLWLRNSILENENLRKDKATLVVQLGEARNESKYLRQQYEQSQRVVEATIQANARIGKETETLKQRLKHAQISTPCSRVSVHDGVTEQLRKRASEINATTGSK